MFKKRLIPGAIVAVFQLGVMHHVSAMEKSDKTPESKVDQPEDKSELTEEEKKRLVFNRMVIAKAIEQTHGEDMAEHGSKDVRDVISGTEYALAPKIIKFKCPTPKELSEGIKVSTDIVPFKLHDASDLTEFTNKDGLKFHIDMSYNEVQKEIGTSKFIGTAYWNENLHNYKVDCDYQGPHQVLRFIPQISDDYNITFDNTKFESKFEGAVLKSEDPNVIYTLTKKANFTPSQKDTIVKESVSEEDSENEDFDYSKSDDDYDSYYYHDLY